MSFFSGFQELFLVFEMLLGVFVPSQTPALPMNISNSSPNSVEPPQVFPAGPSWKALYFSTFSSIIVGSLDFYP